jgi:hypothetical protein
MKYVAVLLFKHSLINNSKKQDVGIRQRDIIALYILLPSVILIFR